ncbi:hypothetical protein U1Q18_008316 [Sarracenia purpurea var. burkii]
MLKALMFVAVYSIGVLFDKESFKFDTMASMLSISVGVAISTYGDAKFDSWGVLLHLDVVAFEVTPLVLLFIFFSILLRLPTSTLSLVEFNREAAEVVGVASARRKKKSKSARERRTIGEISFEKSRDFWRDLWGAKDPSEAISEL